MYIRMFYRNWTARMMAAGTLLLGACCGCDGTLVNGAHTIPTVEYRADTVESAKTDTPATTAAETSAGDSGGVGNLTGRVVYEGDFTPLPVLFQKGAAPKDPSVCGAEAIPNETVVVNNGGLANVFVYLEKVPKGAKVSPPEGDVIFDQKTCVFIPHALFVRTKQQMLVLNDDGVAHNTHTYPKKSSGFNGLVPPGDRKGAVVKYDQVEREPFQVGCDIHPWMQAYHLALDHPFAAVSKPDGTFEIKNLPAGKHEFKVWHEVGKFVEKALAVTIKPGENEITIKVPASKLGK